MIKKSFFLLVVGLIIYSVFLVTIPYYRYYAFKSDLKEALRVSATNLPEKVMAEILAVAKQDKIPIEEGDINLGREDHYIVAISWQERVNFFNLYQKTFEFSIDTNE